MSSGESPRRSQDQSVPVEAEQEDSLTLRQQLQNLARSARRDADKGKRFFMLYLNQETWLGAAGSKLADQVPRLSDVLHRWPAQPLLPLTAFPAAPRCTRCMPLHTEQVRAARAAGIVVVLVHECDPTRGGCEFGAFFSTTPQELIDDGLYARVAIALHSGQHRTVSLCLLAREVGAVRYRMKEALWEKGGAVVDAAMRKVAERRAPPAPKKASLKATALALRLSSPSPKRGLASSVGQGPAESSTSQPSSTNTTGPLVSPSSIGMPATADNGENLSDLEEVNVEEVDIEDRVEERPLQVALQWMQEREKQEHMI